MTQAEGHQQQLEERRRQEEEAWAAHIAYCFGLTASPARGFGPGHTYREFYSGGNNEHVEQVRK
jgi:hypothetical protein